MKGLSKYFLEVCVSIAAHALYLIAPLAFTVMGIMNDIGGWVMSCSYFMYVILFIWYFNKKFQHPKIVILLIATAPLLILLISIIAGF